MISYPQTTNKVLTGLTSAQYPDCYVDTRTNQVVVLTGLTSAQYPDNIVDVVPVEDLRS